MDKKHGYNAADDTDRFQAKLKYDDLLASLDTLNEQILARRDGKLLDVEHIMAFL